MKNIIIAAVFLLFHIPLIFFISCSYLYLYEPVGGSKIVKYSKYKSFSLCNDEIYLYAYINPTYGNKKELEKNEVIYLGIVFSKIISSNYTFDFNNFTITFPNDNITIKPEKISFSKKSFVNIVEPYVLNKNVKNSTIDIKYSMESLYKKWTPAFEKKHTIIVKIREIVDVSKNINYEYKLVFNMNQI